MTEHDLRAQLECAKAEALELRQQLAAAEARAEKEETERSILIAFAREVIRVECWGYPAEIDGGDVQDVAAQLGLIEATTATEEDAATMDDVCAGDRIYRFSPWLAKNGTIAQEENNG
jgi:hypothetical protein